MNETVLRWKGRLGSLRPLAALVLLFAVIFLILAIESLNIASKNPTTPETVAIAKLAANEIETNRYVSVSGVALYPAAYQATEDGKTTEEYFFVIDDATGDMILIKASKPLPTEQTEESVTVAGLTHVAEVKLQQLIESDLPDIQKAGLNTTTRIYVGDGEQPPSAGASTAAVIGLSVLSLACVATFFFPGTVFGAKPLEANAAVAGATDRSAWASGRFKKLSRTQPAFEFGKGERAFTNAVVNLVPLQNRQLMVYIHHVMTYRAYGVKVSQRDTDWGVLIDTANLVDIEPGKLYSWRDKWAVRFRYNTDKLKQQTLIISFKQVAAQAEFVALLRQLGFMVGTGDAPLM